MKTLTKQEKELLVSALWELYAKERATLKAFEVTDRTLAIEKLRNAINESDKITVA